MALSLVALLFLALFISSVFYLLVTINYPTSDALGTLILGRTFQRPNRIRKFVTTFISYQDVRERRMLNPPGKHLHYMAYNIFFYLLSFVPKQYYFRASQALSLVFYMATFFILAWGVLSLSQELHSTMESALLSVAAFSLLLLTRTKNTLIFAMSSGDTINYFLFSLVLTVCLQKELGPFFFLVLGAICGLAFRNKLQDISLALGTMSYLLLFGKNATDLLWFGVAFLPLLIDWIRVELFSLEDSSTILYEYLKVSPAVRETSPRSRLQLARLYFLRWWACLSRLLNPFAPDSLWPSIGSLLLLTPISLLLIFRSYQVEPVVWLVLTYLAWTVIFLGLMRYRTLIGGEARSHCYGAMRQGYMLAPGLFFLNVYAFSLVIAGRDGFQLFLYALFALSYVIHQGYRMVDYIFSEQIEERDLFFFPKKPLPWNSESGRFLDGLPAPVVVLCDFFVLGVTQFDRWGPEKQCIEMRFKATDSELVEMIRKFGVTHLVVAPWSFFNDTLVNDGNDFSHTAFRGVLSGPEWVSPSVKVFEVVDPEPKMQTGRAVAEEGGCG